MFKQQVKVNFRLLRSLTFISLQNKVSKINANYFECTLVSNLIWRYTMHFYSLLIRTKKKNKNNGGTRSSCFIETVFSNFNKT